MPGTTQLFGLLNEIVVFLLGALLILLALTGRFALPRGSFGWALLGVVLIYWGARAWMRRQPSHSLWHGRLRGISLIVVGALMLLMVRLSVRYEGLLLLISGALFVIRGLIGAALLIRIGGQR